MQEASASIALSQAIRFLEKGTEPIVDAHFAALGPCPLAADDTLEMLFVAIKQGKLPVFGTRCVSVIDFNVPNQKYYTKDRQIRTSEPPLIVTTHRFVENTRIPTEELRFEQICFRTGRIDLGCVTAEASEIDLSQLTTNQRGVNHFDSVRVGELELRALRETRLADIAGEKGPREKQYDYDPSVLIAEIVAIVFHEGFGNGTLTWITDRLQEKVGKKCGRLSRLKHMAGKIYHHPELIEELNEIKRKAPAKPRRNSRGMK